MREPRHDDELELAPPPELARLRSILSRPPGHATRARHLAAATSALHEPTGAARRFASRGVRVAVAVVATLAITTGLAAAQVLPPPAQRLFGSVSDRFSPPSTARLAPGPGAGNGGAVTPVDDADDADDPAGGPESEGVADPPTSQGAPTTRPGATPTTLEPRTDDTTVPTVTVPGPGGPGSPDDPTDPGGSDGGSGEPTDPSSTTTTSTTTPGGDGGTTDAGPAGTTTTTAGPAGGGSD